MFGFQGGLEEHDLSKKRGALYQLIERIRRFGSGISTISISLLKQHDSILKATLIVPYTLIVLSSWHMIMGIMDISIHCRLWAHKCNWWKNRSETLREKWEKENSQSCYITYRENMAWGSYSIYYWRQLHW